MKKVLLALFFFVVATVLFFAFYDRTQPSIDNPGVAVIPESFANFSIPDPPKKEFIDILAISPDDLFINDEDELYQVVQNVNGAESLLVYKGKPVILASFSPNHKKIVFYYENNREDDTVLAVMDLMSRKIKILYRADFHTYFVDWDGNRKVMIASRCGTDCLFGREIDVVTGVKGSFWDIIQNGCILSDPGRGWFVKDYKHKC